MSKCPESVSSQKIAYCLKLVNNFPNNKYNVHVIGIHYNGFILQEVIMNYIPGHHEHTQIHEKIKDNFF